MAIIAPNSKLLLDVDPSAEQHFEEPKSSGTAFRSDELTSSPYLLNPSDDPAEIRVLYINRRRKFWQSKPSFQAILSPQIAFTSRDTVLLDWPNRITEPSMTTTRTSSLPRSSTASSSPARTEATTGPRSVSNCLGRET